MPNKKYRLPIPIIIRYTRMK